MSDESFKALGFDEAIIGISIGPDADRIVYDAEKCVEILVKRDNMDRAEAEEYLQFNTFCAWIGDYTPIFVNAHKGPLE